MESKLQILIKESKITIDSNEESDDSKFVICPFDPSHRVPKESYANHMVFLFYCLYIFICVAPNS